MPRFVTCFRSSPSNRPSGAQHQQHRSSRAVHSVERSGVDAFTVRGHKIFVKRDDQLRLPGTNLSGNKARKMYALHRWGPGQVPRMLVSYGGAQSNAMLALALVAKAKGVPLTYFTKPIPRWLRETPSGNYAEALALGANITAVSSELYKSFEQTGCPTQLVPEGSLWIPQGCHSPV